MLMRLSHDLGLYFYDVIVARFDLWAAFGVLAQLVFGARFIVQWIASEKAEKSVIPMGFWFLSIAGGLMTMVYGFARRDIVISPPAMDRNQNPIGITLFSAFSLAIHWTMKRAPKTSWARTPKAAQRSNRATIPS